MWGDIRVLELGLVLFLPCVRVVDKEVEEGGVGLAVAVVVVGEVVEEGNKSFVVLFGSGPAESARVRLELCPSSDYAFRKQRSPLLWASRALVELSKGLRGRASVQISCSVHKP